MSRGRAGLFPLIGLVWFIAAVCVGASGALLSMRPPGPQILLVVLTAALVLAGLFIPSFRTWVLHVDLRAVIALHLSRFVGIYFLVLYNRGLLPFQFAVVGGWGDIVIAVTALALLIVRMAPATFTRWLSIWNLCGFIDIVFVVLAAASMAMADPASMAPLRTLPLSLLPTFLVPLIIASHLLILWRVGRTAVREA